MNEKETERERRRRRGREGVVERERGRKGKRGEKGRSGSKRAPQHSNDKGHKLEERGGSAFSSCPTARLRPRESLLSLYALGPKIKQNLFLSGKKEKGEKQKIQKSLVPKEKIKIHLPNYNSLSALPPPLL